MWGECILYMPATKEAMAMSNEMLGKLKRKVVKVVEDNENTSYTIYIEQ